MGYTKEWRHNVLEAVLNGYRKIPKNAIHRHGASTVMTRRMKRLVGKQTWFKDKNQQQQNNVDRKQPSIPKKRKSQEDPQIEETEIKTVIFIPHTPGSLL